MVLVKNIFIKLKKKRTKQQLFYKSRLEELGDGHLRHGNHSRRRRSSRCT